MLRNNCKLPLEVVWKRVAENSVPSTEFHSLSAVEYNKRESNCKWYLKGGPFDFWGVVAGVILKKNILQAYLFQKRLMHTTTAEKISCTFNEPKEAWENDIMRTHPSTGKKKLLVHERVKKNHASTTTKSPTRSHPSKVKWSILKCHLIRLVCRFWENADH